VLLLSCSVVCEILFINPVVASRTWTVDDDGSADYPTIRQAIDRAADGDTILVFSGTYHENFVVYKSLSIIGEDRSSTIIDGDGSESVVTLAASNITVKNFTIQNSDKGMVITSNENDVADNIFLNNLCGVLLDSSCEGNKVFQNNIILSVAFGIYGDRCGRNVIADNNISFCGWYGVFLYASEPCILDGNRIFSNDDVGVCIRYSDNNTMTGNVIFDNGHGIYVYSDEDPIRPSGVSKFNIIEDNIVLNNSCGIKVGHFGLNKEFAENKIRDNFVAYNNIGLNVSGSNGNSIYNNNFVDNSEQAFISESSNNTWDDGYYAGGNYWSDHNKTDMYWGHYQNETGSDGIIDFPYKVSANPAEEDRYPFLHENQWLMVPELSVVSPSNGTYRFDALPLIFATNKPAWVSYSLDNQPNVTVVRMLINLSIGVHNITVYASDVLGNNVSSKAIFTITFLGDLSLDGTVNIIDVAIVAYSFGYGIGGEKWNPDADLNNDNEINIIDIAKVAMEFGNTI